MKAQIMDVLNGIPAGNDLSVAFGDSSPERGAGAAAQDTVWDKHRRPPHALRGGRMVSVRGSVGNERPDLCPSDLWGTKVGLLPRGSDCLRCNLKPADICCRRVLFA